MESASQSQTQRPRDLHTPQAEPRNSRRELDIELFSLDTGLSEKTGALNLGKCAGSPVFGLESPGGDIPGRRLAGRFQVAAFGKLALAANHAIFDVDETIIANTGRYIHDKRGARFELALRLTLRKALKTVSLDGDRIRDAEKKYALIRQALARWEEDYCSAFAGHKELKVCQEMCRVAQEKLSAMGVEVALDARHMRRESHSVVRKLFDMHREELHLLPGVRELAEALKSSGAQMALCTSSPQGIIRCLLNRQFPGWGKLFGKGHYDATKKDGTEDFSPSAVNETCAARRLNCHPGETVMFGDSKSDMGTAILAGVALVVIRPAEYSEKAVADLRESYDGIKSKHPLEAARCAVVVIKDFSQVKIEPWYKLHERFTSGRSDTSGNEPASPAIAKAVP